MKTTVENLLKIEGAILEKTSDKISLVRVFHDDDFRYIFYRFYKNGHDPDAFIEDTDGDSMTDIHFFQTIEDVINQIYYITGHKLKIKKNESSKL